MEILLTYLPEFDSLVSKVHTGRIVSNFNWLQHAVSCVQCAEYLLNRLSDFHQI